MKGGGRLTSSIEISEEYKSDRRVCRDGGRLSVCLSPSSWLSGLANVEDRVTWTGRQKSSFLPLAFHRFISRRAIVFLFLRYARRATLPFYLRSRSRFVLRFLRRVVLRHPTAQLTFPSSITREINHFYF